MLVIKEKQNKIFRAGFTLIEIILVVAIMSIVAGVSIISWQSFSDMTNLGNTANVIETKLKLAKSDSLSAKNNINYGVHFEAGSVTIFPADAAYVVDDPDNQVFTLMNGVEIYGPALGTDITFSRLTGVASSAADIDIRIIQRPDKTKKISVNLQGQSGVGGFEASTISPINNARHVHFNLGWDIKDATVLHLAWKDNDTGTPIAGGSDILTADYFNVGKTIFDWSGTATVNGVSQPLRIHSWLDTSGYSVLCVMRENTENEKLVISFTDGINKEIGSFTRNDATGEVNIAAGIYGGTVEIQ